MAEANGKTESHWLPFEQPIKSLEKQIVELEARENPDHYADSVAGIREQRDKLIEKIYQDLTPWQTVLVARHRDRPQTVDYIKLMCRDFCELHGDRRFGDDPAIISGFARIGSHKVMLIGHMKGKNTQERINCQFGCAHPEGYRKAMLKMKLAEKYGLPVVTLIDTPGAFPGIKAEERGQAEAIAYNLREMSRLKTPIVCVVIGEGGSGGALGLGVGDRVAMLEHSWYSVISPEGCAAILWKTASEQTNSKAAQALSLTAQANLKSGLIDAVLTEPMGGAHRDPQAMSNVLESWIVSQLQELKRFKPENLVRRRYDRFRAIGSYSEPPSATASK